MLVTILIVLLILALIGMPGGPWTHGYGWYPSGGVMGILIIVVVVLLLTGRL